MASFLQLYMTGFVFDFPSFGFVPNFPACWLRLLHPALWLRFYISVAWLRFLLSVNQANVSGSPGKPCFAHKLCRNSRSAKSTCERRRVTSSGTQPRVAGHRHGHESANASYHSRITVACSHVWTAAIVVSSSSRVGYPRQRPCQVEEQHDENRAV
jgi:hypothetical protein